MYATRADIEAIYGANALATLVAGDVDLDTAVTRALVAVTGEIDAWLGRRYSVPLASPVPAAITAAAIDLACWRLAPAADRASEEWRARADRHLAFLKALADGRADIGGLTPLGQPTGGDAGGAVFVPGHGRRYGETP